VRWQWGGDAGGDAWTGKLMQDKVRQQRVNARLRKQREAAVAKQRRRADAVRRPLRPFWRAVLTEIYLCDVYSCQEILRSATAASRSETVGRQSCRWPRSSTRRRSTLSTGAS
jgi:hypothetical protein